MRYNRLLALLSVLLFGVSCAENLTLDYSDVEEQIFDEWMALYYPDIVDNKQENGYYIDIITVGDTSGIAIADTLCWVKYDITVRNLQGEVTLTRSDVTAWQQGTYTPYTHYTPFFRYSGEALDSYWVSESSYHALRNPLTIGDQEDVYLYNGAEFFLYMPSSLMNLEGDGSAGYEGQYTLDTSRPMISHIKITDMIINPIESEGDDIDDFANLNGGVTITYEDPDDWVADSDEALEELMAAYGFEYEDDEDYAYYKYHIEDENGNLWMTATDTVAHVYLSTTYKPDSISFQYIDEYFSKIPSSPYINGAAALDVQINEILIEKFGDDVTTDGSLINDESASVWYIGRFLNGFIFDTNIEEIRELIFDETDYEEYSLSFTYYEDTDDQSYIQSWYEVIPKLKYGQWAAMITCSTYGYGEDGQSSLSTDSSSYYDYYSYYNYYSSYYGSSYSSSYYNSYYDSSYYDYSSYYDTDTTTTTSTDIQSYTPMIFQLFVEPEDE